MSHYLQTSAQAYLQYCVESNSEPKTSLGTWTSLQQRHQPQPGADQQSRHTKVPHNSAPPSHSHAASQILRGCPRLPARHSGPYRVRFGENLDLSYKRGIHGSFISETGPIFQELVGGIATGECEEEEEQGGRRVKNFTWKNGRRVTHFDGPLPSSATKPSNISSNPPTMVARQAARMSPTPNGNTTVHPAEPSKRATQAAYQVERKGIRSKSAPISWHFFCPVCCISEDNFVDGKHSIVCSECNVWTHSLCQGITKATAEKKGLFFVCMRCRPGAVKFDFLAPLTRQTSKKRQLDASAGESNTSTTSAASHSELRQQPLSKKRKLEAASGPDQMSLQDLADVEKKPKREVKHTAKFEEHLQKRAK
jgi:hypothetical protein